MARQVSVIIPVRDGERYLGEAIDSVLRQTHRPVEIIVVDNGSTDGSVRVAERSGKPVQVVDEPAPGASRARNRGVQVASSELIAFLDADDLWEPSKLAHQINVLNAQHEIDVVFTGVRDFISPELTDQAGLSCRSAEYPGWLPSTMVARTRSFLSIGPFPDVPVGEFIAWYGLAQAAGLKSQMIPEPLVRRRIHLSNTTRLRDQRGGYAAAAKMVLDSRRSQNRRREAS
jgi:glycosyltransferase involved in cell wall biosynthesis